MDSGGALFSICADNFCLYIVEGNQYRMCPISNVNIRVPYLTLASMPMYAFIDLSQLMTVLLGLANWVGSQCIAKNALGL